MKATQILHRVVIGFVLTLPAMGYAQGSLTPPGFPEPMMKTLQQIEPRIDVATLPGSDPYTHVLDGPGSYYLSANVEGSLLISGQDVVLDLNGFQILGIGEGTAIDIAGSNCRIVNGTIRNFVFGIVADKTATGLQVDRVVIDEVDVGISLTTGGTIQFCRIIGREGAYFGIRSELVDAPLITIRGCDIQNFNASGEYAAVFCTSSMAVSDCVLYGNRNGLLVSDLGRATVQNCDISGNLDSGIYARSVVEVENCRLVNNHAGLYHWDLLLPFQPISIRKCFFTGNTGRVIYAKDAVVEDCVVENNPGGGDGIWLNAGTVRNCEVSGNSGYYGIYVGQGTVTGCHVSDNVCDLEFSCGIAVSTNSTVENCTSINNGFSSAVTTSNSLQGQGISATSNSTVINCVASNNKGDGISFGFHCRIINNMCQANGGGTGNPNSDGAGLHATANFAVIDGNLVRSNKRGIHVQGSSNSIFRNSCWGNTTNFQIAADNHVGTIITAPLSPAISGSTGGAGLGTTDPWANFVQ